MRLVLGAHTYKAFFHQPGHEPFTGFSNWSKLVYSAIIISMQYKPTFTLSKPGDKPRDRALIITFFRRLQL